MKLLSWVAAAFVLTFGEVDGKSSLRGLTTLNDTLDGDDIDMVDRKKHGSTGKTGYVGVSVSASHVVQDPTSWNKGVVVDAVTSAYNLHMDNGFTLTGGFVDKVIEVPEEDDVMAHNGDLEYTRHTWADYLLYAGYDCRLCPNYAEYAFLSGFPDPKSDKHKQFEDQVCKNLLETGLQAFSEVKNCNVQFIYPSLSSEEIEARQAETLEKSKKSEGQTGTLNAQIQINRVISSEDGSIAPNLNILTGAWVEAFNAANAQQGWTMSSFQILRQVLTREGSNSVAAEGQSKNVGVTRYYNYSYTWIYGSYDCRVCGVQQGDFSAMFAQMALNPPVHKAFEALLCQKLKASGHPSYSDVTDCNILFTYDGDNGVESFAED